MPEAIRTQRAHHRVIEQVTLDRDALERDAALFALANGTLGIRGAIEELPGQHASFLPDAYVRRPIRYHESFPGFADHTDTRLAGPGITAIRIWIDGEQIDFDTAQILRFRRGIDLDSGLLLRTTHWRLADGREIEVKADRVVPFGMGSVCAARISMRALNFAATIGIEFPVVAPLAVGGDHDPDDPRINARTAMTAASRYDFASGSLSVFVPSEGGRLSVTVAQRINSSTGQSVADDHITTTITRGGEITLHRYTALVVGSDPEGAALPATALLDQFAGRGFAALAGGQAEVLAQFWAQATIAIDGDERLERVINFNLFHIFQSASRSPSASIAAKGLTGEGYEGHYFWDTEAFVAPLLALLSPDLCRNLVAYRCSKLDDARANALAIGHPRGALFPWRTIGGRECSAHYPTGSAQYHINAAIAYAIEQYELATGDTALVDEQAAELLFETARLWFDVGHFSDRRGGAFVIHGVTGPDEYSALVDNDFYTNAMAHRHLRYAAATLHRMMLDAAPAFAALKNRIALSETEADDWQRAADAMWLPVDPQTGVHPQDDGFLDKPHFDSATLAPGRGPMLLRVHPMVLFRHQLCKQGDVLQAHCIAGRVVSVAQMRRNFAYYEPLTTHDSTLSSVAFATVAARAGLIDKALAYHRASALVDLDDLHGNTSHGVHMAAMAGSWLTLAQGWGGLSIDGGVLRFAPRCPPGWRGYSFRIVWRSSLIEVEVTPLLSSYRVIEGAPVILFDHGREIHAGREGISVPPPQLRAVIFDLDGVLTNTAQAHCAAWQRLCDEEGLLFNAALNERLKGVDRAGSLRIILDHAQHDVGEAAFAALMARKNVYYREAIAHFGPSDLFPGARALIEDCLRAGLRVGLASASRNAPELVKRLGIAPLFDHIADAATVGRGKPDPEIFQATADALGVAPAHCIGIEDAPAGVAAIRAAGMPAIGIGDPTLLAAAHSTAHSIADLAVADLIAVAVRANANQPEHETA